jgi:hypothetical protein
MVYFQTKNPDSGKFWKVKTMEDVGRFYGHLVYFYVHLMLLLPFGTFYGHLVHFMVIWYILWSFGVFFPFWYVATRKI